MIIGNPQDKPLGQYRNAAIVITNRLYWVLWNCRRAGRGLILHPVEAKVLPLISKLQVSSGTANASQAQEFYLVREQKQKQNPDTSFWWKDNTFCSLIITLIFSNEKYVY